MRTTTRRLGLISMLVGAAVGVAAPAQAASGQVDGTAAFEAGCAAPPPAYDDYPALVMEGSLEGCWYTAVDVRRTTNGGVYLERGRELFVGRLDGGPVGTFTTTYRFEAKLADDGSEVRGRCQHPLVEGSGTGGFAGATGRLDFKDIVAEEITYVYRGHVRLR